MQDREWKWPEREPRDYGGTLYLARHHLARRKILVPVFFALALVLPPLLLGSRCATATTPLKVYVWDFQAEPGPEASQANSISEHLTEQFEESLIDTGCFTVLERRKYSRIRSHGKNEQALTGVKDLDTAQRDDLRAIAADAVLLGNVRDDLEAGSIRITGTLENFRGEILAKRSVDLPRGLRLDPSSRKEKLTELTQALCASVQPLTPSGDWQPGLRASFYSVNAIGSWNADTYEPAIVFPTESLSIDWGQDAPHPRVRSDRFVGRWEGEILIEQAGTHTFSVSADNGLRIFIGGEEILNEWRVEQNDTYSRVQSQFDHSFDESGWKTIRIDYFELIRSASIDVRWWPPGNTAERPLAIGANHLRHRE